MGAPHDREATAAGFGVLGDTAATFGDYQSSVYTARTSWAESHRADLVAATAALIQAHRYIFADAAGAIAALRAHLPDLSLAAAAAVYSDLVAEHGGLSRDGGIAPEHVEVVVQLRREFAEKPPPAAVVSDFYDLRYHGEAMRELARMGG